MAKTIVEDLCIACGVCLPECPNAGIDESNGVFAIYSELCTECFGFYEIPHCVELCPVDAIETVRNGQPSNADADADLAATVHPDRFPRS